MESELKLPYAETYSFEYPQKIKGRKHIFEYVKKCLYEMHPGFDEESLWDYTIVRHEKHCEISAAVLERNYFLERRLTDGKESFFIYDREGRKQYLFERRYFDDKGERKKSVVPAVLLIITALVLIFLLCVKITKKKEIQDPLPQESLEPLNIEEALNFFDEINRLSKIIKKHEGKISSVVYGLQDNPVLKLSVKGLEPYELVKEIAEEKHTAYCLCDNVVYRDGMENFELNIKLTPFLIKQMHTDEISLLEIQNSVTEKIKEMNVTLVSAGADAGSGRITFSLECTYKDLSKVNQNINILCLEKNLLAVSFSENRLTEKDRFLIKAELIKLEQNQKISDEKIRECLSELFEKEETRVKAVLQSVNENKVKKAEEKRTWKKIGSVNKEGRLLFYYRTQDGKIEVSEEDYE